MMTDKGELILVHSALNVFEEESYSKSTMELRIYTAHYITRYYERNNLDGTGMNNCEKLTKILTAGENTWVLTTIEDEVIRRYEGPLWDFKFLQGRERVTECAYLQNGDIAIAETYGEIPIWKTYITKDMLFDSQKEYINSDFIQEGIEIIKNKF